MYNWHININIIVISHNINACWFLNTSGRVLYKPTAINCNVLEIKTGIYKGHTHNFLTELAFSYGVISLILFIFPIIKIIWISYKKDIYDSEKPRLYDEAWKASFLVILFSQMFDLQYFDFRIGFMFWFLLGGLRNLIK